MRFKRKRLWALTPLPIIVVALQACALSGAAHKTVAAGRGAVVAVEPYAARIGAGVLEQGGNAVDAAVATAFTLAVTWPEAGNLGGGGFMLVRLADGRASFIDYREKAPQAAHERMYLDSSGQVVEANRRLGYQAVGVPGTVAGLWLAHQRFGSLPWEDLVRPAAELAENGIPVSRALSRSILARRKELAVFPETRRVFFQPDGSPPVEGDLLRQPDLARSLNLIARDGRHAFYEGDIAELIVADSARHGGLHTREDFRGYTAVIRRPLEGTYRGFRILAGPPPTSGGQILLQALNLLEQFDLARLGPGTPRELHLIAEAERRAFLDRARFLGDPEFVDVPIGRLLDKAYAAGLAHGIDPARATPSDAIAGDLDGTLCPPDGEHTTHFSVVDRFGNAVANTYTLEESYGAKIVAAGTGILLNNEMGDFNPQPGVSLRDGQFGTPPNLIRPEKRMLSSMCPVIVERDGALFLVAGSPGGRTIPSTLVRVMTGIIDHGLPLADALDLVRIHHGLYPDVIRIEESAAPEVRTALESLGHTLDVRRSQGDCHVIGIDLRSGRLCGVADSRLLGAAASPDGR